MDPILPKNYSDDFKQVLSQPYNSYRENLPVVTYENCFFTHSGIGLKNFKLVEETLFQNITNSHRKHFYKYAIYKYFFGKSKLVEGDNLLLLHNHWSTGYHHWVTEILAKATTINPSEYTLILPEDYPSFAFDSIGPFGFKEIVKLPKEYGLKVRKITLIANPNSGHYDPVLLNKLRKQMIEKCLPKSNMKNAPELVYFSRRNDRLRKVENEDEVVALLSSYGFQVVDIPHLNFYEQVALFSRCKVFVSIHGAALTNALFMPKGTKVLELYRSIKKVNPWMNTCYWNLVTASGLDYYYQFCEHGFNPDTSADNCNIIVDIPLLKKNIELILG